MKQLFIVSSSVGFFLFYQFNVRIFGYNRQVIINLYVIIIDLGLIFSFEAFVFLFYNLRYCENSSNSIGTVKIVDKLS